MKRSRNYLLAIDQSTSATKAVLFDPRGSVLDRAAREHRQIYPQAGWVEHDAEEIWQNTLTVIREMAANNPEKLANVLALSLTNQRETFVVFNRITGQPLHNAIVWQCRRGDIICKKLRNEGYETLVQRKTGLKLDTYFSGSKLKWLMIHKTDLAAKLKNGDALI